MYIFDINQAVKGLKRHNVLQSHVEEDYETKTNNYDYTNHAFNCMWV